MTQPLDLNMDRLGSVLLYFCITCCVGAAIGWLLNGAGTGILNGFNTFMLAGTGYWLVMNSWITAYGTENFRQNAVAALAAAFLFMGGNWIATNLIGIDPSPPAPAAAVIISIAYTVAIYFRCWRWHHADQQQESLLPF